MFKPVRQHRAEGAAEAGAGGRNRDGYNEIGNKAAFSDMRTEGPSIMQAVSQETTHVIRVFG